MLGNNLYYLFIVSYLLLSVFYLSFPNAFFIVALVMVICCFFLILWRKVFFVVIIAILLCCVRTYFDLKRDDIPELDGKRISIDGYIYKELEFKHEKMNIYFRGNIDGRTLDFLISSNRDWSMKYGSLCTVSGTARYPSVLSDFDYKKYLWGKGIYYTVENAVVSCDGQKESLRVFIALQNFKGVIVSRIEKMMHEPYSSLLIGILLGSDRVFDDGFQEDLRIAGTSHIIAASGYNVSILYLFVDRLLFFIHSKIRSVIALLCIFAFCFISGLSASILRATFMISLVILCKLIGVKASTPYIFFCSLFLFVLVDPRIWIDIGFQLSLAATGSLIFLMPSLAAFFNTKNTFLLDNVFPTLSCTIATLPVIISAFKTFSIASLFANILVLPVIQSSLLTGALSLFISFFERVVWVQLRYFVLIVEFFGNLEYVSYSITVSPLVCCLFFVLLFLFILFFYPVDEEYHYFCF